MIAPRHARVAIAPVRKSSKSQPKKACRVPPRHTAKHGLTAVVSKPKETPK